MGFRQFLREYFSFNRRERNGVFVLLSIILFLILYLSFSHLFFPKEKIDFSKFEKEIAAFEAEIKRANDSLDEAQEAFAFSGSMPFAYHNKQYRRDSSRSHSFKKDSFSKYERPIKEKVLVEINSADTAELKKLKGIGSAFARRISKYRDLLGGYVSKEQLMEVYGFDKQKYDLVLPEITIDPAAVKKININTASPEEMKSHPYVRWKLANVITAYRKNHGPFSSVESIRNIDLVNDSVFAKLAPYLTVE